MPGDITYNQLVMFKKNSSIARHNIKKLFIEKGQLILILDDSKKITISGKTIDTFGHKIRIRELLSMAVEKGFDIPEKSIKHYVKEREIEYVLVRW